jgi:hypothetical protein
MAVGLVQKTVGDGNAGTFTATFLSSDGTTGGNLTPAPTLYTAAGVAVDFTQLGLATSAYTVATTITRPANQTPYTANDVMGGALDLGVLGPSAKNVQIVGVQLEGDISAIPSGQTSWVLYLYNVTPPSAYADNAAWDLASGDRASWLGSIPLSTMVDLGSTCYMELNGINKQVVLAGTHLFGYLVTVGAWTPAANSEVYVLTLHTIAV